MLGLFPRFGCRTSWLKKWPANPARECPFPPLKKKTKVQVKIIKYFFIGLGGIIILLLVWGVIVEPRLIDEKEEVAEIPGLPAAWEGRQVALIADLQVGMWLDNTATIRRIVTRLVEQHPAMVLIAGDFIYHPLGEESIEETREELEPEEFKEVRKAINEVIELLRPLLDADIPIYAVLGNHDYGMETQQAVKLEWIARQLQEALEGAGIQVLANEAVALPFPEEHNPPAELKSKAVPLYLVGIGSHYANHDAPAAALDQLPKQAPRIVMMHNPDSFSAFPAGTAPLAVAGHTHGGQIRLPFTSEWSWMTLLQDDKVHADGWIKGYGQSGNHLYVNRGIGFSVLPIRINAPPAVTLFTLQQASHPQG